MRSGIEGREDARAGRRETMTERGKQGRGLKKREEKAMKNEARTGERAQKNTGKGRRTVKN